jgi:nucleoside-diphosphate-sugar epimerase
VPAGEDRTLHLLFVKDLASALERAAEAPSGTYAVADPHAHLWKDVVATIAATLGKRPIWVPLPPRLVRGAAALTESLGRLLGRAVPFNREKAEEMLAPGWVCDLAGSESLLPPASVTPLEVGIEQTVRWYIRQGWL